MIRRVRNVIKAANKKARDAGEIVPVPATK